MLKVAHLLFFTSSLVSFAGAQGFVSVWKLGADDNETVPFSSENYSANAAPGSATARDDDYYLKGVYPDRSARSRRMNRWRTSSGRSLPEIPGTGCISR